MFDNVYGTSCIENQVLEIMRANGQNIRELYYDSAVPLSVLYRTFLIQRCKPEFFQCILKIQNVLKSLGIIKMQLFLAGEETLIEVLRQRTDSNTYILIECNSESAKQMLQIRGWRDDHYVYVKPFGLQYEVLNDIPVKKLTVTEQQLRRLYNRKFFCVEFLRPISEEDVSSLWSIRTFTPESYFPLEVSEDEFAAIPEAGLGLRNLLCVYKLMKQRFALYYHEYTDTDLMQGHIARIAHLLARVEYCILKHTGKPADFCRIIGEINEIEKRIMHEAAERIAANGKMGKRPQQHYTENQHD